MTSRSPTIGIIANPASARDIRRVVANASNLQTADRVNIVLRLLSGLASQGVDRVLMMPDKAGVRALLVRALKREHNLHHRFPTVEFLDLEPESSVEDTFEAARLLRAARVSAIVVLGGDGTHRAVVRECSDIPIAGVSTGTNNAFPEMREATVTALAVGLFATGRIAATEALAPNKLLEVTITPHASEPRGGHHGTPRSVRRDIALVDAVISTERFVGARALWKTENLAAVYLTFADPQAVGLSAIGGLLQPLGRRDPGGLALHLSEQPQRRRVLINAPIAPGLVRPIGIAHFEPMPADRPFVIGQEAGVVALDGERELAFDRHDRVTITLRENAFPTVDVARCMQTAAREGLFRLPSNSH
jgi:predicted polyphosphate/ATP-dependent NAD kinase